MRLRNLRALPTMAIGATLVALTSSALPAQVAVTKNAPRKLAPPPRDSFALSAPLPMDPAVRVGTLPNGLRYYIRRNAKPAQRAELRLVVNAGSVLEDDDQQGLAHFVEHMAFNGTTHFAKNDIVKYLESIGVRFGADLNAYTGFDETVYVLPVPTDSAGILERSLQFLGDVASGIRFDSADVVAERGVVLSEWRTGLGAGERLRTKQFPVIFRGSRYAERLPIGKPAILEQANPGPLRRFWRDWYRPDLMAVIAVGDADPARLERLIRTTFGGLKAPPRARPRPQPTVPRHDSTLVTIATDAELTASSVGVLWKRTGVPTRTVRELRTTLIDRLYNSLINQRFSELALRPDAPFTGAGASSGGFVRGSDYTALDAGAKEGQLLPALRALLTEAERVRQHGFLASELDRARTSLLRAYERAWTEREKTESDAFVEEYVEHFLAGEAAPGITFEYAAVQRLLPQITLADVNAVARERSGRANRVVTVSLPEKAGLAVPTDSAVRAVFAAVEREPIAPWVETVAEGALVSTTPTPGRIVREVTVAAHGITDWTLSNGVRVLVKPTDYTADQLLMTAWSPGGTSLVSDGALFRTSLMPTVIAQGGAGNFSAIDLRKKLTGKVATVTPVIGDLSEGLSGSASPKDAETLLQLIWLRLTAPRADSSAFRALLGQFDNVLRNRDANPAAVFGDTVQVTLGNGHPRVRPLRLEMLQELHLDSMLASYRDRFGDAGEFTFLFVGNVELATFRPLVEQWLGALPATGRRETPRDVGPPLFRGSIDKVVRKGIAPQSQTLVLLAGAGPWSREAAWQLTSLGELLEMRLLDRLRESLGGTYSVSVNTGYSRALRQEWQLTISYGSDPAKADTMYQAVVSVLDSLRRVPPSAEEVERVREQQRRALEVQRKQNGYWMAAIRGRAEYGEPFEGLADEERLISAVTPEAIHEAAKAYLGTGNRARFVLLPEEKR